MSYQSEHQQLAVILLIVFTSFVGASITYPIFPPLFLIDAPTSIIPSTWPASSRSILLGIALAAYPFGQFIGAPIVGGYSDRFGRKYILIITLLGAIIGYFLTALSLQFDRIGLLIISRFVSGIMESNFVIARAMTDDFTHINKYKSLDRINAMAATGYFLAKPTIICAMLITATLLGLMVVYPNQWLTLLYFALLGLSIATVTTHMLVHVSNSADKSIQGEAMGFLLGLRMLGDSIICIAGSILIMGSVLLPIAISSAMALFAAIVCVIYVGNVAETNYATTDKDN